ncbi:hypothetical protein NUW54_g14024 [Trametes sanguinea]|uniref:Uncharacterized protein n=1 Tax=Trametes sanguinea TaxID=158606 RepID=A0ACC1MFD2_9APHY|nr:hypothetical protein NUW54_g14024 [Trametes sanguinea]
MRLASAHGRSAHRCKLCDERVYESETRRVYWRELRARATAIRGLLSKSSEQWRAERERGGTDTAHGVTRPFPVSERLRGNEHSLPSDSAQNDGCPPPPHPPSSLLPSRPFSLLHRVFSAVDAYLNPLDPSRRSATRAMDPYTFGGRYRLEEEIAIGGCGTSPRPSLHSILTLNAVTATTTAGTVFQGVHTLAGKEVAIKLEPAIAKSSPLKQESKIYKTLMGGPGVPWLNWSGKQGDYNVMVIDLLGPSLEDLFRMCNRHFSLKTILMLADQLVSIMSSFRTLLCLALVVCSPCATVHLALVSSSHGA